MTEKMGILGTIAYIVAVIASLNWLLYGINQKLNLVEILTGGYNVWSRIIYIVLVGGFGIYSSIVGIGLLIKKFK